MLRLLADENFNGDIVRGLLLRQPDLDIVRVQDVGLPGAEDADILAWATANNRIVLTHDRATMSDCAYEQLAAGEGMAGVFILNDRFPGCRFSQLINIAEIPKHVYSDDGVHFAALCGKIAH